MSRHGGSVVFIAIRQRAEKARLCERQFPAVSAAKREAIVIRSLLNDVQRAQILAIKRVVAHGSKRTRLTSGHHRQNGAKINDSHDRLIGARPFFQIKRSVPSMGAAAPPRKKREKRSNRIQQLLLVSWVQRAIGVGSKISWRCGSGPIPTAKYTRSR